MTKANRVPLLRISTTCTGEEVATELRDQRPDSVALFLELDDIAREQLALDAWTIGLRALANAHDAAQESKLKDIGSSLLTDIDQQLRAHVEHQQQTMSTVRRVSSTLMTAR